MTTPLSTEQIKNSLIVNLDSLAKGGRTPLLSSIQKAIENLRNKQLLENSEKRVVALDNFRFAASWLNYRSSDTWNPSEEAQFKALLSQEILPAMKDLELNPQDYAEVPKDVIQAAKQQLDQIEQEALAAQQKAWEDSFTGKAAVSLKKVSLKVAQVAQKHLPKLNILLLAVGMAYRTENPAFLAFAGGYALTC